MLIVAAYVGLRFGELAGLRRRDVDLLHQRLVVTEQLVELADGTRVRTPPKTKARIRRVSMPATVSAALAAHLDAYVGAEPDSLLFTGARGGTLTRRNWARIWSGARQNAGLPPTIHLHDLRHYQGTLAAQLGATTKELMARLGHSSPRAAMRYQHASEIRDRLIADKFDEVARAAANRTPGQAIRSAKRDAKRNRNAMETAGSRIEPASALDAAS